MPAEDGARMSKFYQTAFGWETNQMGPEMGNYIVVTTSPVDENRMVKAPGTINGGFYPKTENPLQQHPSIVISVDDINESIEKVKAAGGKIETHPVEIPGIGMYVTITDTEGNHVSLLQPKKM
jgi:predicted enzyme related to lactoylglutathione lyase